MGKILRTKSLTTGFEAIIVVLGLAVILTGVYYLAPGLRVDESKQLDGMELSDDNIDNKTKSALIELPSTEVSSLASQRPLVRIAGYAWNSQSGIIVANGGPKTTEGSIMEKNGLNVEIIRQDWVSELRNMQMKFIEEFDRGVEYPKSNKSVYAVMIMGDGAPYYISTMQAALDEKFGEGKYHVEVQGCFGMSNGEDKLIGPKEWKTNPQTMKGCLISAVLGDGDWVVVLNYASANGLKVNPDVTTYDPEAVNFYPSEDDDYINSAKELIKSQNSGFTVELKEIKDGKLTGKTIKKKIDGCATWTPGDKMVFDAVTGVTDIVSTREFKNQMPTTFIGVKEWASKHPKTVSNILKSALTASNQMKQYDSWRVRASEAVAETFNLETPKYWYNMFKGEKITKNGMTYNVGGSKVLNYADVMQYYGITDGIDRYKSVYNQVSSYLTELNPFGFNESVKGVVPYKEAVNLYYLKNIEDIEVGTAEHSDYTETKSKVMASGNWSINFSTGSATIESVSYKDLEKIYNLLIQAEDAKLRIVGHTDNVGNPSSNKTLSKSRANAVVEYLESRGIPSSRIQEIDGKGDAKPIASNATAQGKAKNRRVEITLLN
jgi:outer membrane protein OmpA-like peptidoglycan-associated protein